MDDDWDLHAVVRGCINATSSYSSTTTTTNTTTTTTTSSGGSFGADICFSSFGGVGEQVGYGQLFSLSDPFEVKTAIGELHELYKPFFPKSSRCLYSPQAPPSTSASSFSISVSKEQTHQMKQQRQPKQSHGGSATSTGANSHAPRSKRRKNQLKKICLVPVEALSSDVWAWRKYGQKPIKGSPYPRGYYRCSSSKGCLARKQVERNRSDPRMFTVTYTGEHNHPAPTHRSSLAGSTRQKTPTPQTVTTSDTNQSSPAKPTCSSPANSVEDALLPQSTNTEGREEKDIMEDDEEDELGEFSEVSDDFFMGLEELADGPATEDCSSDHFPPNFGLPWPANSAAATTAGSI